MIILNISTFQFPAVNVRETAIVSEVLIVMSTNVNVLRNPSLRMWLTVIQKMMSVERVSVNLL